ncbi:universal stress protein [Prauserella oleivorans]|uniref:Universal stress protein n=1 Tax=Prauserella oleivorans TaxID=1478153 RepID=A0ABW5WBA5_9PSEU
MTKIVVGVDGSSPAVHAAVWAAGEAVRRREVLRLVHAYVVPAYGYPDFMASTAQLREALRREGVQALSAAEQAVRGAEPEVEVETDLVEGQATAVLRAEARQARFVALGSRGLGGFPGLLVGSVATVLSGHARSPVVVVRGSGHDQPPPAQGQVVVGVDGSDASGAALGFAFDEAALRGVPLRAVRVWNDVTLEATARIYPLSVDPDDIDAAERDVLQAQLDLWIEKYPGVATQPVVARGLPARTLLEFGGQAQLLVLGSRGRGGFRGMLLGSTSQALIAHAPCPVAVVRADPAAEGAPAWTT